MRVSALSLVFTAACGFNPVNEGTDDDTRPLTTDGETGDEDGEPTTSASSTSSAETSSGETAASTSTSSTTSTTSATSSTDTSSSGATTDDATTEQTTGGTTNTLVIEGFGEFPVKCALDDADCGARTACELVTHEPCEKVDYDCQVLGVGSYTTADFVNSAKDFSFALYPIDLQNNYGNICSCLRNEAEAKDFLGSLGLATDHLYCGLGGWFLK